MQGQRSVAEMLLKLSDIEPGENIVDELYNGTCPKNAGTQNTHKAPLLVCLGSSVLSDHLSSSQQVYRSKLGRVGSNRCRTSGNSLRKRSAQLCTRVSMAEIAEGSSFGPCHGNYLLVIVWWVVQVLLDEAKLCPSRGTHRVSQSFAHARPRAMGLHPNRSCNRGPRYEP